MQMNLNVKAQRLTLREPASRFKETHGTGCSAGRPYRCGAPTLEMDQNEESQNNEVL